MWTVVVLDPGGKLHSRTPLKTGAVTLGRGETCDIVLKSQAVSRLHGRLLLGGSTPIYSDENSANGSLLDGQRVQAAVALSERSVLDVGGFRIRLEREGSAGIAAAEKTLQFSPAEMARLKQAAPASTPAPAPAPVPASPPPAAPTASAPGFQSPLAGMQFKIPDTPPAAAHIGQVQHDKLADSMAHLLDQQIRGIQSRRSEQEQSVRSARESFEAAWREAVVAARELQARVQGNPKVLYYVVTRDEQEVSAKISDGSRRGYANLILSRRHPETGKQQDGYVWLGVLGENSYGFREPKDALEEFVRRIAGKLA